MFIRGNSTLIIQCGEDDLVREIKKRIAKIEDLKASDLLFYCEGAPVGDRHEAFMFKDRTINHNVPLICAKVHGSLARAEKVRGQTLNVEKQEKKENTGRAKELMQYNKMIVNTEVKCGTRSRPNSNSRVP